MIGVLDSGYGGLTIVKELLKVLPEYNYMYLGDNARTPYGNRSQEVVQQFSEEAIHYLLENGCQLIIVACNTISTQALRYLQEKYIRGPGIKNKNILGVTIPMVEEAIKKTRRGHIGVVGTKGTIASGLYEVEIKKRKPDLHVYSQACPLLVPFIEEGWSEKPEARSILRKYLRHLKSCNIDTLILGCTHYPFMMKSFRHMMGKQVYIPEPGRVIAKSLEDYLERHSEIEQQLEQNRKRDFLTTGSPEDFRTIGSKFFGKDIGEVIKITLPHVQP